MTQETLRKEIEAIILDSGFASSDLVRIANEVSIFALASTLAARLINNDKFNVWVEANSSTPVKEKDAVPTISPNELLTPHVKTENVDIVLKGGSQLPKYGTEHSAGFDLAANFVNEVNYADYAGKFGKQLGVDYFVMDYDESLVDYRVVILPGCSVPIPTGVYVSIPINHELQVRPRSGIASKKGLTVINSPGTIDCDYRGEIIVLLYNSSKYPQDIVTGMKIAQAILSPVVTAKFTVKRELDETVRGAGGFGHTGITINK